MGPRWSKGLRVGWALLSVYVVESVLLGVAALPAVLLWRWHVSWTIAPDWLRVVTLAMSLVPAYLAFAVTLAVGSAAAARLLGWRSPDGAALRIADFEWPLLDWARYLVLTHVARLFVGVVFRATPLWTLYLRLNGARLGRGVFVNSTKLMDHNLLELGDDVVVGSDVHLSGHTVEGGVVRTASVRIGAGATLGVGCVVGIGSRIGARAQIGALSVVPKHAHLAGDAVYVGAPARRLDDGAAGAPPAAASRTRPPDGG